jgi:hypothetical protein
VQPGSAPALGARPSTPTAPPVRNRGICFSLKDSSPRGGTDPANTFVLLRAISNICKYHALRLCHTRTPHSHGFQVIVFLLLQRFSESFADFVSSSCFLGSYALKQPPVGIREFFGDLDWHLLIMYFAPHRRPPPGIQTSRRSDLRVPSLTNEFRGFSPTNTFSRR